jgi:hypothetical protein
VESEVLVFAAFPDAGGEREGRMRRSVVAGLAYFVGGCVFVLLLSAAGEDDTSKGVRDPWATLILQQGQLAALRNRMDYLEDAEFRVYRPNSYQCFVEKDNIYTFNTCTGELFCRIRMAPLGQIYFGTPEDPKFSTRPDSNDVLELLSGLFLRQEGVDGKTADLWTSQLVAAKKRLDERAAKTGQSSRVKSYEQLLTEQLEERRSNRLADLERLTRSNDANRPRTIENQH